MYLYKIAQILIFFNGLGVCFAANVLFNILFPFIYVGFHSCSNKEGQMGSSDNKPQTSPYHVKCLKEHEPSVSWVIFTLVSPKLLVVLFVVLN